MSVVWVFSLTVIKIKDLGAYQNFSWKKLNVKTFFFLGMWGTFGKEIINRDGMVTLVIKKHQGGEKLLFECSCDSERARTQSIHKELKGRRVHSHKVTRDTPKGNGQNGNPENCSFKEDFEMQMHKEKLIIQRAQFRVFFF